MKKLHKIIALLLVAVMLLSVSAAALAADIAVSDGLALTGMSNASVNQAVENYFDERADYLLGDTASMDWLVVGIANDEVAHMAQYNAKGIVLNNTVYTIESMECYDTHAEVIATETISYTKNGIVGTEEVTHNLTLYLDSGNIPVVAADGYTELCTDFESCSYVAPTAQTRSNTSVGGSPLCIIEVAKAELGTREEEDNITKYGEWYGWNGVAWCAIFVSWCANQANIDTSIIEKAASCDVMMNDFIDQGNFYYSQNFGGSYIPQPGDILFVGTVIDDSTHVGIVEKVENNEVWIYDGNYSDKVNYHRYRLSASDVIGYGHPDYPTTGHTSSSDAYISDETEHWKICDTCNTVYASALHTMVRFPSGKYRCNTCGYAPEFSGVIMQLVNAN